MLAVTVQEAQVTENGWNSV